MLRQMRHISQTWLIKLLLLFLVATFAIWGIGDIFHGNPAKRGAAKIGGVEISAQELETQFQRDYQQMRQIAGPDYSVADAKRDGMLERSVQNMIQQSLFDQEAARLGLTFSNLEAVKMIRAIPGLVDKTGNFNARLFQQMLYQVRMSEADYVAAISTDAARQVLIEAIRSGLQASATLTDSLAKARGQERIIRMLAIDNASMGDMGVPDDATLAKFHSDNAPRFTAPEYRDVVLLQLMADDIAGEIAVTDADLEKAYSERIADYSKPELRSYDQVIAQNENEAKTIAAEAQEAKSLKQAAAKHDLEMIPINDTEPSGLLPELKDTVMKLEAGGISGAVKSGFGWHVIQITDIKPGHRRPLSEVKDELRKTVVRDQAIEQLQTVANKVDDAIAGGAAFEEIARDMKLRVAKIGHLGQNGKTPEDLPNGIPDIGEITKYAYNLEEGEASSMIDDGKGNYFVIRTDKASPSHLRPLDEVRGDVIKAWQAVEQAKKARARADEIAAEVRDGKSLDIYTGTGITMQDTKPVSVLTAQESGLPASFIPQILAMKKKDVGVASDGTQHFVMQLTDLRDTKSVSDKQKTAIEADALRGITNDVFIQFTDALRKRFPVSVNESTLAAMRAQSD
ncbi:MAG: hypothetical protein GC131_01795 [Alphaproteobacteria bacterium]|nr:hypothetical protein [Alphaproteobacteria bacterium]